MPRAHATALDYVYGVLAVISKIQVINYLHMSRGSSARDIAFDPSSGARLPLFVPVNRFPGLAVDVSDAYASNTTTSAPSSFALGELASVLGDASNAAIGYSAAALATTGGSLGSTSVGSLASVDGISCFALGKDAYTDVAVTQATAIGSGAYAGGDRAFALGRNAAANNNYSLAVGEGAVADAVRAVAIGKNTTSEGFHIGNGITSTGDCFGINSAPTGVTDSFEIGTDSSFGLSKANSCALIVNSTPVLFVDANGCRTGAIMSPATERLGTYTDGQTVAAADFRDAARFIVGGLGANGTLVTPTAADVIAAHPGAIDNDCFDVLFTNTSGFQVDWVAGVGVTIDMDGTGYTSGRNFNNQLTRYTCVLDVTGATMTMYFSAADAV